jgi:hypothetical protein
MGDPMKAFLAAVLLAAAQSSAFAVANPYSGFQQYADSGSLKPFTRDLGGLLGGATFHDGRSLGFSGFDVGVRYSEQFYPSKGDNIMLNNGVRSFGLPWVQAEIGLPFKIDGFIRGISYNGVTVSGGGIRYGLYNASDKPWAPQVLISGVADTVVHQAFSASHFGLDAVASAGTTFFLPYAGVGVDRTRLVVRSSLLDPTLNGDNVTTVDLRFTAGVRLKIYQFTYVNLAYVNVHDQSGAEGGLGVRF